MESWIKYIIPKYEDKSVKDEDCFRMKVARQQAKKNIVEIKDIKEYCDKFLKGLKDDDYILNYDILVMNLKENPIKWGFYTKIKNKYNLSDKGDIVWLKFTKDGYLGVVASSNDINFSDGNTSGKILKFLGKKWNKDIVVIIPLKFEDDILNRQLVESGIGNYLISKDVPILDYFSHNL